MSEPLPLFEGAAPCRQCGWCCKQASCGAAPYDSDKGQCSALVDNGNGTYGCGKYDEILAMPRFMWELSPAFGAGCCSAMNEDRRKLMSEVTLPPEGYRELGQDEVIIKGDIFYGSDPPDCPPKIHKSLSQGFTPGHSAHRYRYFRTELTCLTKQ